LSAERRGGGVVGDKGITGAENSRGEVRGRIGLHPMVCHLAKGIGVFRVGAHQL